MEPDILLCTPLEIENCIHSEFPGFSVQIEDERDVINIVLPQFLDLPNGSQVTISTVVQGKY